MMKNGWVKALFRELNTPEAADPAEEERHRERWQRKRQSSEPPAFAPSSSTRSQTLADDYDAQLALLARQSLQLDKRPDAARQQARQGWPEWHLRQRQQSLDDTNTAHNRMSFPQGPAYSPDRLAALGGPATPPRPGGPRPIYSQEASPHDLWAGASSYTTSIARPPGGFVDPVSPPLRRPQASRPLPSPSHAQARPHTYSSPARPSSGLLQTPPSLLPRPHSDPYRPHDIPAASKPHNPAPSTPAPTPAPKANQCHGTTAAGKRCTRTVGSAQKSRSGNTSPQKERPDVPRVDLTVSALMQLDRRLSISRGRKGKARAIDLDEEFDTPAARLAMFPEQDDELWEELPVYCFQHAKQTLEQKGIFVGSNYIDFQDWIPPGLPQDTKLQLRHEMSKPFQPDDPPGYIYVHEMACKDHHTSPTTFIKLGRSIKPIARLNQWKSQCRSREPIVRDIFPLHAAHPLKPGQTASGLLNQSPSRLHGELAIAERGAPNHHRWERLCLIELAGLAAVQAHARREAELAKQKCPDCGQVHVELFLVDRGSYEREIIELVLRWQRFVELST